MKKIATLTFLLFLCINGFAQFILFSEGFESGELPLNWREEFVKGSINWRYEDGGYTLTPGIPNSRKPIAAHGGEFNALFQYQSTASEGTKLVTKKIESLEFAIKPELHFYHAQLSWKHGEDYYNDYLRVYYKSSATGPWIMLRQYIEATTDWVERIILLPEDDLSADYYLAFEGETKWGFGTCVDDIEIVETGILQKYLTELSVEQISDISVASGTSNNPILRLKLKVMGNSGTLPLNSLLLKSLNTSDSDVELDGVKIYHTSDADFSTENQIGTGISFISGQASFEGLNFDLPTGYSYLWITYDIKPTAGHRNIIDGMFDPYAININGQTYFTESESPSGSRTVLQSIYHTDFETLSEWTLSGEFQHGSPSGLGGSQGNPDPASAYNGSNIIGTDLTGLGDYPGDYEKNLTTDEYSSISDTFDFTYYTDLSIRYRRYLNIGINDEAYIKVSQDDGLTWHTAWSNSSMILDDSWKLHEVDITQAGARHGNVLVKFCIGSTNDYWQLSGWNIDDFTVTGKFVSKDVGIDKIVTPVNGCGHTSNDSVTVIVKNYGATDSYGIIPLKYSINGGGIFRDTLYGVIPFGGSVPFKFKKKADLSVPDIYNLLISTDMSDDDDRSNDAKQVQLYIQPSLSSDHVENFESKGGLWMSKPGSVPDWECGTPGFGITPPSGSKLWMTQLVSNYPDNDSSFVESVCYTNEEGHRKILHMKFWMDLESDKDGVALQYSTDNGSTWQILDTLMPYWNWYNDTIQKLDSRGWSGTTDGNWMDASVVLPSNLTDSPLMKFRMAFASNEVNNGIGFAFDNFSIFKAPMDIGATAIESFSDACQYINPELMTVTIRNFGINSIDENDTIIAGFDLNHIKVAIDTFHVSGQIHPGQTFQHTFSKPVDAILPGDYNLTAFTLSEKDPWLYSGNNDTASLDFTVLPNPLTSLVDTIQTRLPDTVVLHTIFDADYDYWWNGSPGSDTYNVSKDGWQYLKVTDTRGNGCSSYDSTNVELLFFDVGTAALIHPVNDCGLSKNEYVTARVKNFGTDSITAGQKIAVCYIMNNGVPVSDTLLLENTLHSGKWIDFTFTNGAQDLSTQGIYNFKIYTSYDGDTIAINDTVINGIEILGRPAVSLGPDITVEALSHTLDPGTGYVSYEWDNGITSQTRVITESGSYWIRVFDANECDNYDTAYIRLKIRDICPEALESPLSGCSFNAETPVTLRILNSGNDTLVSGSSIAVSYLFQGSEPVNENMILGQNLLPGASVAYTFTETVDLSNSGDFSIEVNTFVTGDLRSENDEIDTTIYRYPKPVVDFGLEKPAYIEDVSVLLEAGYNPFYEYDWQDTATTHSYLVTGDGLYHVKVTDFRTQCFDRDTVRVFLIYNDIAVTWSDMPSSGCKEYSGKVSIRVTNLGPSSIAPQAPIRIAIDVNGERLAIDTLTRSLYFHPGVTLEMELTERIIAGEGISLIEFYTLFGQDKKPENDTLSVVFEILPSPEIDFGDENGNLTVDLPYILDAGPGHQSYLWQDNSNSETFTVTEKGEYRVTVTGMNDCQTIKTVRINMLSAADENQATELFVYPNPGKGIFRIDLENLKQEATLKIFNNQGQQVYIRTFTPVELNEFINVQHLPVGVYFMILQEGKRSWRSKIVIE